MSSKILINASHHDEIRVAIVENAKLSEYDHDRLDSVNKKGCIFKGYVSRIEPGLNAAFIDYGANRHGFLPVTEISLQLYPEGIDPNDKPSIQQLLKEKQEIIVQVDKDERGNKGAALTTNISLAGCYIVLMPMTSNKGGISRQIEGDDRDHLIRLMNQMDIPDHYSIIVRTASIGRNLDELLWDFNVLKSQWEAIVQYSSNYAQPVLLYKDGALLSRIIRDYLRAEVEEIIIDDQIVYEEVLKLVQHIRPDFLPLVKLFSSSSEQPLFAFHGIEHDIESIFNPQVILGNGSTLVIDHREALTSIDINSARSTSNSDIETTAFKTNLAAAVEIARQIRLRNIGGQIVIDFIDMSSTDHCRQVEQALKEALSSKDKARIQVGKISKFGLLEMSRQRMKTSLDEVQLMQCEACHGRGMYRRPRSAALSILRLLEQESINKKDALFEIKIHPKIADLLCNTYRHDLCVIEKRSSVKIVISAQFDKSIGDYEIVSKFATANQDQVIRNYVPANAQATSETHSFSGPIAPTMQQAQLSPPNPQGDSLFKKLWKFFFGAIQAKPAVTPVVQAKVQSKDRPNRNQRNNHNHNQDQRQDQRNNIQQDQSDNKSNNNPNARRRPSKKPSGGPLSPIIDVQPVQQQSAPQTGEQQQVRTGGGRRHYRRPSQDKNKVNKTEE